MKGGGGGWEGGVSADDILSENDAKGGVISAVSSDQVGATYAATANGYRDAFFTNFPDDSAGNAWFGAGGSSSGSSGSGSGR
jgi:hypothetical protein